MMRKPDKNNNYQQGLLLKRDRRFIEAIDCFEKVRHQDNGHEDPDLLFNLGVCYWKLGDLARAAEYLEIVIKLIRNDPDAENILRKIRQVYPRQLPDFRNDAAVIDANFIINFYNKDSRHFPRFLKKARKKFNLYMSLGVYAEMLNPEGQIGYTIDQLQQLLDETAIILQVNPEAIRQLERKILSEFEKGIEIKARHAHRSHAWNNDLSLIYLLGCIKNPIKYIVTNDIGVQEIIQFLHPNKDPHYYIRPNELFRASVNEFCQTTQRALWEQRMYGMT